MALKQGKKQVNLKGSVAENIGIAPYPKTNITAQIAQPISQVVDTFRKRAEADAKVSWQYQFNQSSRDHYLDLRDKFKSDPDGMRNAVDSYSKSTLANTPPVFKEIAGNILAQKNLSNLSFATTNYNNEQTQLAIAGWETAKEDSSNDMILNLDTISNNENLGINDINNLIGNTVHKQQNHNYKLAEDTLVETQRVKQSVITKDLNNDIVNTETLRVFNIIKKLGDVQGNQYFLDYAKGKDSFPLTPENTENPIYQKYLNQIKDPFERTKIISNVKKLYDDYNGQAIGALKDAIIKYDVNALQDYRSILDVDKFKNAQITNATDYVMKYMPNASSTVLPKAIEIANKNINVQKLVSKAINNEIIDNFENNEQMELFKTALFRRQGIDDKNITDVNNRILGDAMEILKRQNMEPTAVLKKIDKSYNVGFDTPGTVNDFEENLSLYNFVTSQDMFPYVTVKNKHIYEGAKKMGIMNYTSVEEKSKLLDKLMSNQSSLEENYKKISDNIDKNKDIAINNMKWTIEMQDINTDTFWLKKIFIKNKNEFSHLFIPENTSAWYKGLNMTPLVQQEWLNEIKIQLAYINGNNDIDLTTDEGKEQFYNAGIQGLKALNKKGFSATRLADHNGEGQISMIKNGFEQEIGFTGQGFDSALMAQANWLQNNLTTEEQIERFGYTTTPDGKGKETPVNISDVMKTLIDENYKNLIVEPTGTYTQKGNKKIPNYHAKIIHEGKLISLTQGNNYFDPIGFGSNKLLDKELPESRNQVMTEIANKKFELFMQKGLGQYIDSDSATDEWLQKFFYGTTKTMIEASDYRFYPDFPLIKDIPNEVKPFGFIFKVLGKDVDVESYYNQAAEINNEVQNIISYDTQIQQNRNLTDKQKIIESRFPPYTTSNIETQIQKGYRQYVYNNYQNKDLPLALRSNNWMFVKKTDQTLEGQIADINLENNLTAFASPVDSIKAGLQIMINNSSIIQDDTIKKYGHNPTIIEILKEYPVNTIKYANDLEEKTNFTRDDTINFYDANQVSEFVKFLIQNNMGDENFNKYYPPNNQELLYKFIFEGYTNAINSYSGKLNRLK